MERDSAFARQSGYRLLKNETGRRVSQEAAEELIEALEDEGKELAREARRFAEHADRKTIQREDVRQAVRRK